MNRAQNCVIRSIAGIHIFQIPGIIIRPRVELFPYFGLIAPQRLHEHDETLFVQIIDLPVNVFEELRIDTLDIGKDIFVTVYASWKQERPSTLVVLFLGGRIPHDLTYRSSVAGERHVSISPRSAYLDGVPIFLHRDKCRLAVVRPCWETEEHGNQVETLGFAKSGVILDARFWTDRPRFIVVEPRKMKSAKRPPGIAFDQVRRAIGVLESVSIRCCPNKSSSYWVLFLFRFGPRDSSERACFSRQSAVSRGRAAGPRPLAWLGGHDTNPKDPASVPVSVNSLFEVGTGQIDPHGCVHVRVRKIFRGGERNFLLLPHVDGRRGGSCKCRDGGR